MNKLIITSIAIITVAGATGFALLNQPKEEIEVPTKANTSTTVSKPTEQPKEAVVENVPTNTVVPPQNVPVEVVEPTEQPYDDETIHLKLITSINQLWHPKETGVALSNQNVYLILNKEVKQNPNSFLPSVFDQNVLKCLNRIIELKHAENIAPLVNSGSCL